MIYQCAKSPPSHSLEGNNSNTPSRSLTSIYTAQQTQPKHTTTMQLIRGAHAPDAPSRQPTETFTGTVHMDPIFKAASNTASPNFHCMANNVMFTPGARTFWHAHEHGQILTVTLGTGFVQSQGQQPCVLRVGDVVHVPAGERHWHGAGKETVMAHTAISLGTTTWFEEVGEGEYEKAHEAR